MHERSELEDFIETPKVIVGRRKDGIIHVFYKENTIIDFELQKELLIYFKQMANQSKHPFIFEADKSCSITREARQKATTLENQLPMSCSVTYAQNFLYKLFGEFFLKINKPKTPYAVFSDFKQAIAWLLETHKK